MVSHWAVWKQDNLTKSLCFKDILHFVLKVLENMGVL